MKNIYLKLLISVLIGVLFMFLFFAFVSWSLDPSSWGIERRFGVALMGILLGCFFCIDNVSK